MESSLWPLKCSFDGGGETIRGVLHGEEAGVGWAVERAIANERRDCADGDSGDVWVDDWCGVVAGERLLDDRRKVGVAAMQQEMIEGLVLDFEFETLSVVGE